MRSILYFLVGPFFSYYISFLERPILIGMFILVVSFE